MVGNWSGRYDHDRTKAGVLTDSIENVFYFFLLSAICAFAIVLAEALDLIAEDDPTERDRIDRMPPEPNDPSGNVATDRYLVARCARPLDRTDSSGALRKMSLSQP